MPDRLPPPGPSFLQEQLVRVGDRVLRAGIDVFARYLDLVVANGHIYPQIDRHPEVIGTYAQRSILLDNRGPLGPGALPQFVDVTDSAGPGFQRVRPSRGLAVADYDNDGDLDLLITNLILWPLLIGTGLSIGALDKRLRNTVLMRAVAWWNGVLCGIFLLLVIGVNFGLIGK